MKVVELRVGTPTKGRRFSGVVEVHYGPKHTKESIKGLTFVDHYIETSVKTRIAGPCEIRRCFHPEWP